MSTFEELGLSDDILRVLEEMEFDSPTDIQQEAIPQLIGGDRDFIGLAQTGTGKTAAFGLPLLEMIDPQEKHTQALVLAPTRELGRQIAEQLGKFSKYVKGLKVLPVYGGAAIMNQIKDLKKPTHIIIATPGRLIDLIKRKAVKLDQLKFLVLDEADEMVSMGFKEELDEILSYTPENKQTWLFSATMAKEIKRIVSKYMDDPIEVKINSEEKVNVNIKHQFVVTKNHDKTEALTRLLDMDADMRGVVFCRTRRDTQELAEALLKKGYAADALHGDLSQQQRDRVMGRFKKHSLQVLIATDVAARGIDVDDLTHVFHFSLPDEDAYYTHRSGRTARAGKKGISLAFIGAKETHRLARLEKTLGISFQHVLIPSSSDIADIRMKNWSFKLLETATKEVDSRLMEKVLMVFGNLSKEEIIGKLLALELEKLKLGDDRDLNQDPQKPRSDGGGGGGRGRGGRRDGGRRADRGRDRSSRDRDRRGGGDRRRRSDDRDRSSSRRSHDRFADRRKKSDDRDSSRDSRRRSDDRDRSSSRRSDDKGGRYSSKKSDGSSPIKSRRRSDNGDGYDKRKSDKKKHRKG